MPTAAGYAAVSLRIFHAGMLRNAYVTYGVKATATTDPFVIAAAQVSHWTASMNTYLDSQATMNQAEVHYGVDGIEDTVGIATNSVAGTNVVASVPANTAVLAHKATARGGRRGKGRIYFPWFVQQSFVDETGTITTSATGAFNTVFGTWLNAMTTASLPMVVLHRVSKPGTVHPSTPGPPNLVTQLYCDPVIGTQRRRLGR